MRRTQSHSPVHEASSGLQKPGQGGFSLLELVIVIAILGILSAIVAVFLAQPLQAYLSTVERAGLVDVADNALRRMARDLRLAPHSVWVAADGKGLELMAAAPVHYHCDLAAGTLTRYTDYRSNPGLTSPPAGGRSALLATGVTDCHFGYTAHALAAGAGYVSMALTLSATTPGRRGESVSLYHGVYVDTPP